MIVVSSTTGLEACVAGKPLIVLEVSDESDAVPYASYGAAMRIAVTGGDLANDISASCDPTVGRPGASPLTCRGAGTAVRRHAERCAWRCGRSGGVRGGRTAGLPAAARRSYAEQRMNEPSMSPAPARKQSPSNEEQIEARSHVSPSLEC